MTYILYMYADITLGAVQTFFFGSFLAFELAQI